MKKMKRMVALGLCLIMGLSMTACGSKTDETTTTAATQATTTTQAAGETTTAANTSATSTGEFLDDTTGLKIECEPIELSMGCSGTVEGTVMGDAIDKYLKELKEWTDGNFVINFYPSGQLGGDTEMIEGVQMGSVDIFIGAPSGQIGLIPELAVLDIGGLYSNVESCNAVLTGGFQDLIEPYYNKVGMHLLTTYATNFRILTSNKPVETANDLKGLTIRTQENKYHMAFWKELGTNPTPLAFGELYIALQQGMIDAQENPWASIVGAKLNEVQKYVVETNHIPYISTNVMNQAKYEGLSDTQKQALDQFIYSTQKYIVEGTEADDAKMKQLCIDDFGIQVTEVSDEIKALFPAASQVVIDMLKQELDSAFVEDYVAAAKAAEK